MSKELKPLKLCRNSTKTNPQYVNFTEFWGGDKDGFCVQITLEKQYVELNKDDLLNLKGWLEDYTRGMII